MAEIKEIKVGSEIPSKDIDWNGYHRDIIGTEVYAKIYVFTDWHTPTKKATFLLTKTDGNICRCVHNDYYEN